MEKEKNLPYEEIYDMYIIQNKNYFEIMEYYKISKSTFFRTIRKYGIKKEKSLASINREKNVLKKYGVKNVSQLKEVQKKKEETSVSHYGVKNPTQSKEVREKTISTNLKKYNAKAPAGNKEVLKKMQATCKERYGEENPSFVSEFKEKRKQTNLQNFGVECNLSLKDNQEKVKKTVLEKYGVPFFCMTTACKGKSHGSYSKINNEVAKKLRSKKIKFQREFPLNKYVYDFKIGNILLEINPTYTHSVDISYHNKKDPIKEDYHFLKSKNAKENGFLCIHVFDWVDLENIIENILKHKYNSFEMREREIRQFFVNIKEKKIIKGSSLQKEDIGEGFVRVFDDGFDLVLKK